MMAKSLRIGATLAEEYLLVGQDLACRRGGRLVFEALSFALKPGDAMLLSGPNGSGKSSLMRLIAGYLPMAEGHLQLAGERVEMAELRRSMAYVGHANPLKPTLSVAANLTFLTAIAQGSGLQSRLDAFGLAPIANMPARYLSSGQRRRAVLAAGLSDDRPIWLLDEPGVGLDRDYRRRLEEVINMHLSRGGVVIAASHGDVALPDPLILDFSLAA